MGEKYTLPSLPYDYNALEPYIDEETMRIHHDKHHQAYVDNLNKALEKYPELSSKSAEDLIIDLDSVPEDIRVAVRNNGGGHVNHTMFWKIMTSPAEAAAKAEPSGKLLEAIKNTFGSFEDFKNAFNDAGLKRFGSGWVWLVRTHSTGSGQAKLDIISTANQDNPMSEGHFPIMGNDVWEHAYYLKYRNVRADYLKAWWNVVNWEAVVKQYEKK